MIQIEADAFNWLRTGAGTERSDQMLFTNPTIKYGLGASTDIQLNWAPLVRTRSRSGADVAMQTGVGDVVLLERDQVGFGASGRNGRGRVDPPPVSSTF